MNSEGQPDSVRQMQDKPIDGCLVAYTVARITPLMNNDCCEQDA